LIYRSRFYLDFGATPNLQSIRGGTLVQSKLNQTGTALDRKKFSRAGLRKTAA
jgi:hypothetical protein